MRKLNKKKVVIFISFLTVVIVSIVLVIYTHTIPGPSKELRSTFKQESEAILPEVTALKQGATPKFYSKCYELSHTYTNSYTYCVESIAYDYDNAPLPESARDSVIADAIELDKVLTENGWKIDDRQNDTKTVAEIIPTEPLEAFHVNLAHYYKEVRDISCAFGVEFGGPTDGISPGVIIVNDFSCQQHLNSFMLHFDNYYNSGFGG